MARALASSCTRSSTLLTMRLFSSTTTTTAAISLPKSPLLSQSPRRSVYALSQVFFTPTTRFGGIRFRVNRAGDSAYSPLNSSGSNPPPTEMAPPFPGLDYNHWLILMDKPGGEGATKQQMIDCYVKTLAQVLGSEGEAKKKIYNVSCVRYFGFGCEINEETSNKLKGLNGVLSVLPDAYVDFVNKDYGAELFVNGEIVQRPRPPERQKKCGALVTKVPRPRQTKVRR